jgi:hypothetical protein
MKTDGQGPLDPITRVEFYIAFITLIIFLTIMFMMH